MAFDLNKLNDVFAGEYTNRAGETKNGFFASDSQGFQLQILVEDQDELSHMKSIKDFKEGLVLRSGDYGLFLSVNKVSSKTSLIG